MHVCSVMSDASGTPWTVWLLPLFMEFSRQGYWSGLPFLTPGDLPDPRIEPRSSSSQGDSLSSELQKKAEHEELMLSNCGAGEDS